MTVVHPDVPTLRLTTLRRLLPRDRSLQIFDVSTSIGEVWRAIATPGAVAAIVDEGGTLQGTAALADLVTGDPADPVESVMARTATVALPELELDEAWSLVQHEHTDRVLVVNGAGRLLGILTASELAARLGPGPWGP